MERKFKDRVSIGLHSLPGLAGALIAYAGVDRILTFAIVKFLSLLVDDYWLLMYETSGLPWVYFITMVVSLGGAFFGWMVVDGFYGKDQKVRKLEDQIWDRDHPIP